MPSDVIINLKPRYKNGEDKIGRDLIGPCLKECKIYRRGTGTFTSSALKAYVGAIDHLLKDNVKIQILCSPKIDLKLIKILQDTITPNQRLNKIRELADQIPLAAIGYVINSSNTEYQTKLLSYLIAKGVIEIKFAIPKEYIDSDLSEVNIEAEDFEARNMYHIKYGYFVFSDESIVAFDGSVNESDTAHHRNTEYALVFKSWDESQSYFQKIIKEDLDLDWEERNNHIKVFPISDAALKKIKEVAPNARPKKPNINITNEDVVVKENDGQIEILSSLWPHQKDAVIAFLEKKTGILEMATGTGKTFTALEIIRYLYLTNQAKTIIICTYGTDLLDQWYSNILSWISKSKNDKLEQLKLFRNYNDINELIQFTNSPNNSLILISREPNRLRSLLENQRINWSETLIIHDEIHGFGSPTLVRELNNLHNKIKYKLGLSATPERIYDSIGQQFISNEIGEVIFKFPLEKAIEQGILCEFDYKTINFELQEEDNVIRRKVFSRQSAALREGRPWSEDYLAIELSKVVKKAVIKPSKLYDYLKSNPETIKSSIIYVLDSEQGDSICEVINQFTHSYKTYYQGTSAEYLNLLADGKIDSLVACERLNEGVDIKQLNTVILVSSNKARLDTIQRIGRCLRKDPHNKTKKALVVDFILSNHSNPDNDNSDQLRKEWLSKISNVKNIERD